MPDWYVLSQTVTAKGEPREFATFGELEMVRQHAIAAERSKGGSDDRIPRRALGIGVTRAHARRSLVEIISAYDPSYRLLPPR